MLSFLKGIKIIHEHLFILISKIFSTDIKFQTTEMIGIGIKINPNNTQAQQWNKPT